MKYIRSALTLFILTTIGFSSNVLGQATFDFGIKGIKFGRSRTTVSTARQMFDAIEYKDRKDKNNENLRVKFIGTKNTETKKWDRFLVCKQEVLPKGSIRPPQAECVIKEGLSQEQNQRLFEKLSDKLIERNALQPAGAAWTTKRLGNRLWYMSITKKCPFYRMDAKTKVTCSYESYIGGPKGIRFPKDPQPRVLTGEPAYQLWKQISWTVETPQVEEDKDNGWTRETVTSGQITCSKTFNESKRSVPLGGRELVPLTDGAPQYKCIISKK